MEELNRRLAALAEQKDRLDKLTRQAKRLEEEQRGAKAHAEQLAQELSKEQRDVERLEGASLSALLASFFGSKEEKLNQERQEAEAARLRYDEARVRAEGLARELAETRSEIASLAGTETTYRALLAQKEERIRAARGLGAQTLLRLDEAEQEARRQLKEIEEARRAGQSAGAALDRVASALQSAENWGTWDVLGGGFLATAVKHSHMDEAQNELYAAQQALSRFRRELADVHTAIELPTIELDGFLRFADYFFDGLFADIAVQNRISQSRRSVEQSQDQVSSLLDWLQRQASTAQAELERVQFERARYIAEHGG